MDPAPAPQPPLRMPAVLLLTSAEALSQAIDAALADVDREQGRLDHRAATVEDTTWHPSYQDAHPEAEQRRDAWHTTWREEIEPALAAGGVAAERRDHLRIEIAREFDRLVEELLRSSDGSI